MSSRAENSANGNTSWPTGAPFRHKRQRKKQTPMTTTTSVATATQIRAIVPGHLDLCTSKGFLDVGTPLNSHSKAEHGLKKQDLVRIFPLNFVAKPDSGYLCGYWLSKQLSPLPQHSRSFHIPKNLYSACRIPPAAHKPPLEQASLICSFPEMAPLNCILFWALCQLQGRKKTHK